MVRHETELAHESGGDSRRRRGIHVRRVARSRAGSNQAAGPADALEGAGRLRRVRQGRCTPGTPSMPRQHRRGNANANASQVTTIVCAECGAPPITTWLSAATTRLPRRRLRVLNLGRQLDLSPTDHGRISSRTRSGSTSSAISHESGHERPKARSSWLSHGAGSRSTTTPPPAVTAVGIAGTSGRAQAAQTASWNSVPERQLLLLRTRLGHGARRHWNSAVRSRSIAEETHGG